MGGIKSHEMDVLASKIWQWCIDRKIWISCSHVAGDSNKADFDSRHFCDNAEWKLDSSVFSKLIDIWGKTSIDVFASRLNTQLPRFASWKPDPESECIDAFSFQWKTEFCYLFPPFSLISRCVQKIVREEAEVLIIVPLWPTQIWYTQLLQLLIDFPRVLPRRNKLLWIPQTEKIHPLEKQMRLIACHLSGKISKNKEFHLKLPISSLRLGDIVRKNNIQFTSKIGFNSVVKGRSVQFLQL
jgi:hypothetical protein